MGDRTKPMTARPRLMGILNLTPDSFSDGGLYLGPDQARGHALRMVEEGADIIDVGGESTRPGAPPVPAEEQIRRVVPVIEGLRLQLPATVAVSIDTRYAAVAAAALDAGASMINDVAAGRDDPEILHLAAARGCMLVLMHMQGTPMTMQRDPHYHDVVAEVRAFLLARAQTAEEAGVPRERIILDPGIGFGKTTAHNLALLAHLEQLVATGYAVLLGTSRKRFMRSLCAEVEPRELVAAICATTAIGVLAGVSYFRVHDVKANRQAADVAHAIASAKP